jgi:peptidoglycan/xylan/chitin deacetylase (PgdA/CDA1 family)
MGWVRAGRRFGAAAAGAVLALVASLWLLGSWGHRTAPAAADTGADGALPPPDGVIWRVPTRAPEIAVTFDDGPDPVYTPQVLQELTRHAAVGTFFVLGVQAERYPDLVRAVAAQGSEVCSHGWNHTMLRGRSAAAVEASVLRTQALLRQLGLPPCPLFRFPYFASDPTSRGAVARLGYRIVAANQDTRDWQLPPPERMAERVLSTLRPGDIVLFHDGGGPRSGTVRALGMILRALPARGLKAVTVSTLLRDAAGAAGRGPSPAPTPGTPTREPP